VPINRPLRDKEEVNAAPAIDDEGESLDFWRSGERRTEVAAIDQNDGHAAQDVQKGDIAGWPGKQVVPSALKQARDRDRTRSAGIVAMARIRYLGAAGSALEGSIIVDT